MKAKFLASLVPPKSVIFQLIKEAKVSSILPQVNTIN